MDVEAADSKAADQRRRWYQGGYSWEDKYRHAARVQPHEPLERYIQGGFHPVAFGDTFYNDRYEVRHKLGYGGYSTVWLVRDTQLKEWMSLKIKQADVSTTPLEDDADIKALTVLELAYTSSSPSIPRYFARLLNSFQHHGPNGIHTCIVTELLGPTLSHMCMAYNDIDVQETFRPDTILRASKQLLEAIHAIHESGIAHGDISPSNVAWTCQSILDNESEENMIEALGGTPLIIDYTGTDTRPDNLPKQLFRTAYWSEWYDCPEEDIRLIDWGESFPIDETRTHLAQPHGLQSPETFFIGSFDYRLDLWRAGCVIHTLFHQREPFGFSICKEMNIWKQTQVIGPLPPEWHEKWLQMIKESQKYIPPPHDLPSLSQTFEPRRQAIIENTEKNDGIDKTDCTKDDYEALRYLLGVMKGLMQHEPSKRTAAEAAAAQIDWIDGWIDSAKSESGDSASPCGTEESE